MPIRQLEEKPNVNTSAPPKKATSGFITPKSITHVSFLESRRTDNLSISFLRGLVHTFLVCQSDNNETDLQELGS